MLKKLSLAALIAMGSVSFATATPLTDAIKNVDINGFLRVRLYNEDPENTANYNRWRTNAVLIFKVPVSEEIKFVMRNSVETNVYTNKTRVGTKEKPLNGKASTNIDDSIVNNLLFMQYSKDAFNLILGKIPVATSATSADPAAPGHGAGAIATYKVNDNLTIGAAFVDALKNANPAPHVPLVVGNDLYAATALFNVDVIKGNVWYYHATDLVDSLYTISLDANIPQVEGLALHADYAAGKLDSEAGNNVDTDTHTYFNIAAKFGIDQLCAKIGYAATNDKGAVATLSTDAPIAAVIPTANNYSVVNLKDVSVWYGKLGYKIDAKASVYGAVQVRDGGDYNDDLNEYTIGAKYAYSKKLGFDVYYDIADWDKGEDNNEFRFEAKYSF